MVRPSKKSAIVEAAMRVAEEQGLSAVTIDAVAEQAGITKGGLLYHFPNQAAHWFCCHCQYHLHREVKTR